MSVIIYGEQGNGKTSNAAELGSIFALKDIIDDWKPGDNLPENTLALTNVEGVEDAIHIDSALESLERYDLERDLPRIIKGFVRQFTINDVTVELRLFGKRTQGFDDLLTDVLIYLGCTKLRRTYDKHNSWFMPPPYDSDGKYGSLVDSLRPFVESRAENFSDDDVLEFLNFDKSGRDGRDFRIRIWMALNSLRCVRFEQRWKSPRFMWMPASSKHASKLR